jgi:hypothetical protein
VTQAESLLLLKMSDTAQQSGTGCSETAGSGHRTATGAQAGYEEALRRLVEEKALEKASKFEAQMKDLEEKAAQQLAAREAELRSELQQSAGELKSLQSEHSIELAARQAQHEQTQADAKQRQVADLAALEMEVSTLKRAKSAAAEEQDLQIQSAMSKYHASMHTASKASADAQSKEHKIALAARDSEAQRMAANAQRKHEAELRQSEATVQKHKEAMAVQLRKHEQAMELFKTECADELKVCRSTDKTEQLAIMQNQSTKQAQLLQNVQLQNATVLRGVQAQLVKAKALKEALQSEHRQTLDDLEAKHVQGQQAAVAAALAELQSDNRLAALARQTESWQEEAAQKQQHSDALEDAQLTILKFQKAADVAKYDAEQKVADATCKNALAMEKAIHLAGQAKDLHVATLTTRIALLEAAAASSAGGSEQEPAPGSSSCPQIDVMRRRLDNVRRNSDGGKLL